MPIKCAGAPQKAMYLSCDDWLRRGVLSNVNVEFNNAGGVLFGVATYVAPLMKYIEKYKIKLAFNSNLIKVDGNRKVAWFEVKDTAGNVTVEEKAFDILHVVPPQTPPCLVRNSLLADAAGWCEVDHKTLQNPRYLNVFSLGDVSSTPNAKTAAAARKQVGIVAKNIISYRLGQPLDAKYDGYGSCPLTVEKGKVILAEFGYGGKLLPTFPLDSTVPRSSAWFLKATLLPWVYWNLMIKGREWLANTTPQ
jgi:sulfide:quinone oxidoreductase